MIPQGEPALVKSLRIGWHGPVRQIVSSRLTLLTKSRQLQWRNPTGALLNAACGVDGDVLPTAANALNPVVVWACAMLPVNTGRTVYSGVVSQMSPSFVCASRVSATVLEFAST